MARTAPTPPAAVAAAFEWSKANQPLPPIAYPFACLHALMCSPTNKEPEK